MPVAGIFKRLKDFAIKGMKGANVLNKVYKTLAPVVDMAFDFFPYGSLVKHVLHGISTGIDVANNLVTNVKKRRPKEAIEDVNTLVGVGNTMYNAVNTQMPTGGLISDIRNNSRQGFQSNQQSQPRESQPIGSMFGNPMNGMITAQNPRQSSW